MILIRLCYCLDGYNKVNFLKDRMWSRNLSEVRAVSKNFGIMEQHVPPPPELTIYTGVMEHRYGSSDLRAGTDGHVWTMQSCGKVVPGDYVSYFRWRTWNMERKIPGMESGLFRKR